MNHVSPNTAKVNKMIEALKANPAITPPELVELSGLDAAAMHSQARDIAGLDFDGERWRPWREVDHPVMFIDVGGGELKDHRECSHDQLLSAITNDEVASWPPYGWRVRYLDSRENYQRACDLLVGRLHRDPTITPAELMELTGLDVGEMFHVARRNAGMAYDGKEWRQRSDVGRPISYITVGGELVSIDDTRVTREDLIAAIERGEVVSWPSELWWSENAVPRSNSEAA